MNKLMVDDLDKVVFEVRYYVYDSSLRKQVSIAFIDIKDAEKAMDIIKTDQPERGAHLSIKSYTDIKQ